MDAEAGGKKPLRQSSNKAQDIFNTYKKSEGGKDIPISEENEEQKRNDQNMDEQKQEKQEEQQVKQQETEEQVKEQEETEKEEKTSLEEIIKERDEYKERMLRTAAELENVRRRTAKEKQELIEYSNQQLLFKMLELLDDIEKANEAGKQSDDYEALLKGVEMIEQKAKKLFNESGVQKMEDPVGKEFDVDYHEAMMTMPSDEPEGTVVQVIQPGYMIRDKVLRHAKVVTSSGKKEEEN